MASETTSVPGRARPDKGTWALPCALLLFLLGTWYVLNNRVPIDFGGITGASCDYNTLALGHAINVDDWVRHPGRRTVGYFQTTHPGLPFQVASWLAYRAAALTYPASADPVEHSLGSPATFYLMTKVAALTLTLGAVVGLWLSSRNRGLAVAGTVVLACFCYEPAWQFSFTDLGNDSFALPAALGLFTLAAWALTDGPGSARRWAWVGAAAGLCYLIKLNYGLWGVAVVAGLATAALVGKYSLREAAGRAGLFVAGWAASVLGLGLAFLGWGQLKAMTLTHFSILTHTGLYGNGQGGLVSLAAVQDNLVKQVAYWPFVTLAALTLAGVGLTLALRRSRPGWLAEHAPQAVMLAGALVLTFLAALKHYWPHYVIPAAATLPFLLLWLLRQWGRTCALAVLALALLLFGFAARDAYATRAALAVQWEQERGEAECVLALSPRANGVRLWSYGTVAPQYLVHFVAATSGLNLSAPAAASFPRDLDFNIWSGHVSCGNHGLCHVKDAEWEYAVFSRKYFPDPAGLPDSIRGGCVPVFQGQHLLVVRNAALPSVGGLAATEAR